MWLVSRRTSLAGRLLFFQLALVSVVVLVVAAVSLAQSRYTFESAADRRVRAVAEHIASLPVLRFELAQPGGGLRLVPVLEDLRTSTAVSSVVLADAAGTVLAASDDPRLQRTVLPTGAAALERGWLGSTTLVDRGVRAARAPVLGEDGHLLGAVLVALDDPGTGELLLSALPDLLAYLAVAGSLGVLGSVLLARRVKRQTLGLEPAEIAELAEHREAMLQGIQEGVLGLDVEGRVTLVNEAVLQLLDLPADCVGRRLSALVPEPRLVAVLLGEDGGDAAPGPAAAERLVVRSGRLLVCNRTSIERRGRALGSVTTLRDHIELVALQQELGVSRDVTETLRALTHEFANRLHTISGLIQLGRYDDVVGFVEALGREDVAGARELGARLAEPAVAALVVAKASLARERGVVLDVDPDAELPRVGEDMAADLVTVVGNLVDNAIDAVTGCSGGEVVLGLWLLDGDVVVEVRDNGPGIDPRVLEIVFRRGVTTKAGGDPGGRGHGLALVQLVCGRRGGRVEVRSEDGARFLATLPLAAPVPAAPVGVRVDA